MLSFSQKIFITLRSRVQIPISLQSLSTKLRGFFVLRLCRKLAFVNRRKAKKPNSKRSLLFVRLWVRRPVWDDSERSEAGNPRFLRKQVFCKLLNINILIFYQSNKSSLSIIFISFLIDKSYFYDR
jgi:hypothetical protein